LPNVSIQLLAGPGSPTGEHRRETQSMRGDDERRERDG
jgi:hypothetical protein